MGDIARNIRSHAQSCAAYSTKVRGTVFCELRKVGIGYGWCGDYAFRIQVLQTTTTPLCEIDLHPSRYTCDTLQYLCSTRHSGPIVVDKLRKQLYAADERCARTHDSTSTRGDLATLTSHSRVSTDHYRAERCSNSYTMPSIAFLPKSQIRD